MLWRPKGFWYGGRNHGRRRPPCLLGCINRAVCEQQVAAATIPPSAERHGFRRIRYPRQRCSSGQGRTVVGVAWVASSRSGSLETSSAMRVTAPSVRAATSSSRRGQSLLRTGVHDLKRATTCHHGKRCSLYGADAISREPADRLRVLAAGARRPASYEIG